MTSESPDRRLQDAGKDVWVTEASLPSPRDSLAAATLEGRIYVMGGCTSCSIGRLATVQSFDPRQVIHSCQPQSSGLKPCGLRAALTKPIANRASGSKRPTCPVLVRSWDQLRMAGNCLCWEARPRTRSIRLCKVMTHVRESGAKSRKLGWRELEWQWLCCDAA